MCEVYRKQSYVIKVLVCFVFLVVADEYFDRKNIAFICLAEFLIQSLQILFTNAIFPKTPLLIK